MATLNLKSIATLVSNQAAAMQATAATLLDFSKGAILLAVTEANAAVSMWLQSLILMVLAMSRLATSSGVDVDTFVGDFGMTRLQSSGSSGQLTFSRYTPTNPTIIPVGATSQVPGSGIAFTVIADLTNPLYSSAANGYTVAAGVSQVTLPVQSTSTGLPTNVLANTVTQLTTSISGIDYVTNAAPMTGGTAAEKDASVKVRFALFILGFSRANRYGIESCIANLAPGVVCTIGDQVDRQGNTLSGWFFVIVDDGTGVPSANFMASATAAVDAYRGLGIRYAVFPPTVIYANVSVIVGVANGYSTQAVVAGVAATLRSSITALGLGAGLQITQIGAWAWQVPGVASITDVLINGQGGDGAAIAPNFQVRILPNNVIVDV